MSTFKEVVRRGTLFSAALAVAVGGFASLLPTTTYADTLNPLTKRTLKLSSSSPGWAYTDGSGNATYAVPNSGANGQKTGNMFSFNMSTDTSGVGDPTIQAMTFKYCTEAAGDCTAPGDNGWSGTAPSATRNADSATTSDLNITIDAANENAATGEISSADFATFFSTADAKNDNDVVQAVPNRDGSQGFYAVTYYDEATSTWVQSTGWSIQASNEETGTVGDETATGKNNYLTIYNSTGEDVPADTRFKVVFFGTDSNYITNPGSGDFFVKINTYDAFDDTTPTAVSVLASDVIDGGVTVANVMNESIHITTKVLETMDFSVGTVDPNNLPSDDGAGGPSTLETARGITSGTGTTNHGVCDPLLMGMTPSDPHNILELGNQTAESSLSTTATYSTHSYFRLSSNSTGGATVYYAGVTLSNIQGDQIDPIYGSSPGDGIAAPPTEGTEQFGLALAVADTTPYEVYTDAEDETGMVYENAADMDYLTVHSSTDDGAGGGDVGGNPSWHTPQLAPLVPADNYDNGAGDVNSDHGDGIDTEFAFLNSSNQVPIPVASESTEVVDCVTAKVRYMANIASTTPSGIYTTKINYIAAPQY